MNVNHIYPVVPLRDVVIFPHMVLPLFVGREKSINALKRIINKKDYLFVVTQKRAKQDNPKVSDLYDLGTLVKVLQLLKLPDGTVKILVEGVERSKVVNLYDNGECFEAEVIKLVEEGDENLIDSTLMRTSCSLFEQYVKLNSKIQPDVVSAAYKIDSPSQLSDVISSYLNIKIVEKLKLLEQLSPKKRLNKVCSIMKSEISFLQTENKIRTRVKNQMEKMQKEYYLNEQMKAIQKELGETDDSRTEFQEIEKKIKETNLSPIAKEKVEREFKKIKMMAPSSSEATVIRNYLDWILEIPWEEPVQKKYSLDTALEILDTDHYGLKTVKDRILEYLAVQKRMTKVRGPILCLVGPPGVGKTSLGQSIARAVSRKFVRISLGGVRDEAEIRGHRRTYIGSMPGKIIQGMRKANSTNPLFLLDELDKLGHDWRGDPSSALLEVLDPEQNKSFSDHYLEIEYDLSNVLFITTANLVSNIPLALQDRLEIIQISGYTEREKLEIAYRHIIPKQFLLNGLKKGEINLKNTALEKIIQNYTRESGVRNLEREISKICRKSVKDIYIKKLKTINIDHKNIKDFLGIEKFKGGEIEKKNLVGITTGLAWTEFGGEILLIEALLLPGKGKILITGKLGEVMKESIHAAVSYARSKAKYLKINTEVFEKNDIHIHVPEGAIPKDGPSAGVTMCVSIFSVLLNIPVSKDVAMTGEITLRGRVLPIGGLKEKLLAAHRAQVKTVLIPKDNEKDLAEVPKEIKDLIKIIPITTIHDAIKHSLVQLNNKKVDWNVFSKKQGSFVD